MSQNQDNLRESLEASHDEGILSAQLDGDFFNEKEWATLPVIESSGEVQVVSTSTSRKRPVEELYTEGESFPEKPPPAKRAKSTGMNFFFFFLRLFPAIFLIYSIFFYCSFYYSCS